MNNRDRASSLPTELSTDFTDDNTIITEENFEDTLSDLKKFQLVITEYMQSKCADTSRAWITTQRNIIKRKGRQNETKNILRSSLSRRNQRIYRDKDIDTMRLKEEEAQIVPPIYYIYYKEGHGFQQFTHIYHLVRDCKSRVDGLQNITDNTTSMPEVFVLRIGIVGNFTADNLKLISKRTGKADMPVDHSVWSTTPLLCFENDISSESALEILRREKACHKILVQSHISSHEKEPGDSFIIVDLCKEQIKDAITTCLIEPLHQMLQDWLVNFKIQSPNESRSDIISEIHAIQKQMAFCTNRKRGGPFVLPSNCTNSMIPDDVKEFLFRTPCVHSFGIWRNITFKVFVSKTTDEENLKSELIKINKIFFSKYLLEIEKRKLMTMKQGDKPTMKQGDKPTMKQGDPLISKIPNEDENCGTLGGFVTKTDDARKIFALTCNHVFPYENQVAYTENAQGCNGFGNCVFTTREKSCDFASIEVMETFLDKCDVAFRNTMKKKINARVHAENLENIGVVHKIGAQTDLTNGYILSSEYYDKLTDENNREYIFLVKGMGKNFSEEGDSGSLVFSLRQNYVDVVGMVYANNPEVYEEESEDEKDNKNPHDIDNSQRQATASTSTSNDEKQYETNEHDARWISFCYRIHTALQLFEEDQGEDFSVKFKDDLSSSSSSTSDSSESDHSNEETH